MKSGIKSFIEPSFLVCAIILAAAGISKSVVIQKLGIQLIKLPIPLKKPLELLDETELEGYKVVNKVKIDNKDVLESLGTKEYLQWTLEDSSADKSSTVRYCSLFITYYTGNPDQVPHVPEECYVGGGNQCVSKESAKITINHSDVLTTELPNEITVRYSVFSNTSADIWAESTKYPVLYFFKVNGAYASSRTGARKIMGENLFGKYSYFSIVSLTEDRSFCQAVRS